jgi:hypothetical protein
MSFKKCSKTSKQVFVDFVKLWTVKKALGVCYLGHVFQIYGVFARYRNIRVCAKVIPNLWMKAK